MEALFFFSFLLYILGMFWFGDAMGDWLADRDVGPHAGVILIMFTWPLLLLVMWATKERAPKKPELQAPLYGHNILEWQVRDTLYHVKLVKSNDPSEEGRWCGISSLQGWTDEGYVWGTSGDVCRITPETRNVDAEKRKAQREAEHLRKSLERDAELAKRKAEEFQRLQQEGV